jgi:hypothetical protein
VPTEWQGPGGSDGQVDGAVFGRDGGEGGQGGGGMALTVEEERDGVVSDHGGEGRADDTVLGCSNDVEAIGVAAASKKAPKILAA